MKVLLFFGLLLLVLTPTGRAQQATGDSASGIVVHADPRLALLLKKPAPPAPRRGVIHSGRGFRVQIYAGNDRAKAMQAKVDFAQRFPKVRTYLSYSAPQFKVKAGDYTTRADAARMQSQAGDYFSPVMIVPDIIVVNTMRNDY